MADRLARPCPRPSRSSRRPSASTVAALVALVSVAVAPACGRYDRAIESGEPEFDSDLGDGSTGPSTSTSTGGATTTTTTASGGPACDADACPEVGARACDEGGVITCEDAGGCLRWSAPAACGADESCDGGACVPTASSRFDEAPRAWRVPDGGTSGRGFNGLSGGALELGDAFWSVVDVDGDRRLDLVVTSRAVEHQNYKWWQRTLGYPNAPHWEVYRGGDDGFALQPVAWSVPADGHDGHGLVTVQGTPELLGDAWWTLLDVDGDARPELVITGHSTVFDGWIGRPLGYPSAPYWAVYTSDDQGFAAAPTMWRLPPGGPAEHGYYAHEERAPYYVGDPAWTTRDLDGDGYVDLVVTGLVTEMVQGKSRVGGLGTAKEPIWEVYRGGPGGFADEAIAWSVPVGGWVSGGFALPEGEPAALGDDRWRLADLDGDGRDDLVAVASVVAVGADEALAIATPGHPEAPHWWFHRNRGDGFERSAAAWTLPPGGLVAGGFVDLEGAPEGPGDQGWSLRDLDGDRRLELVIMAAWEEEKGCEGRALGLADGAPRWDVHEAITLGFAEAPRPFAIPGVGACGLVAAAGAPLAAGDPAWTTVDVDGDGRPDLALTAEALGDPLEPVVFAHGQEPRWQLYRGLP